LWKVGLICDIIILLSLQIRFMNTLTDMVVFFDCHSFDEFTENVRDHIRYNAKAAVARSAFCNEIFFCRIMMGGIKKSN